MHVKLIAEKCVEEEKSSMRDFNTVKMLWMLTGQNNNLSYLIAQEIIDNVTSKWPG